MHRFGRSRVRKFCRLTRALRFRGRLWRFLLWFTRFGHGLRLRLGLRGSVTFGPGFYEFSIFKSGMRRPAVDINCLDDAFPSAAQHSAGEVTDDMKFLLVERRAGRWTLLGVIPGQGSGSAGKILFIVLAGPFRFVPRFGIVVPDVRFFVERAQVFAAEGGVSGKQEHATEKGEAKEIGGSLQKQEANAPLKCAARRNQLQVVRSSFSCPGSGKLGRSYRQL